MDSEQEKMEREVDALRKFKETPGYKALADHVQSEQAALLQAFLSNDDKLDLIQLRADFRAWDAVFNSISYKIQSYDIQLEQQKQLIKQQQRGAHYG